MQGLSASLSEIKTLQSLLSQVSSLEADVMICPPATLLAQARYMLTGSAIMLGAQDCHPNVEGAHTGDISAEMLADAGATAELGNAAGPSPLHAHRQRDHAWGSGLPPERRGRSYRRHFG